MGEIFKNERIVLRRKRAKRSKFVTRSDCNRSLKICSLLVKSNTAIDSEGSGFAENSNWWLIGFYDCVTLGAQCHCEKLDSVLFYQSNRCLLPVDLAAYVLKSFSKVFTRTFAKFFFSNSNRSCFPKNILELNTFRSIQCKMGSALHMYICCGESGIECCFRLQPVVVAYGGGLSIVFLISLIYGLLLKFNVICPINNNGDDVEYQGMPKISS